MWSAFNHITRKESPGLSLACLAAGVSIQVVPDLIDCSELGITADCLDAFAWSPLDRVSGLLRHPLPVELPPDRAGGVMPDAHGSRAERGEPGVTPNGVVLSRPACSFVSARSLAGASVDVCKKRSNRAPSDDQESARLAETIENEILVGSANSENLNWSDIAGLQHAKQAIKEILVWPLRRPDLFVSKSLRRIPKGVLLFGPPGTGKTMVARCIANQVNATFFCVSAATITSKWIGQAEKLVKSLFTVARIRQPSVIFLDEIDSLLKSRSDSENEATRRVKTEFLIQFDGAGTLENEQILVIGATNRPQELDEAARRRFKKRLYIPLPDESGREQLLRSLFKKQENCLIEKDYKEIILKTAGYSGSDITALCEEAAMVALREMDPNEFENMRADCIRPISRNDVDIALDNVRPSVSANDIVFHEQWNKEFGSKL